MRYLTILFFVLCVNAFAEDKEADLQMPVSDISEIQQEQEEIPTLDEVEMEQEETTEGESETPDTSKAKPRSSF